MNKQLICLALLAVSLVSPWRAYGEFVVEVTKGQTEAIPLAVVPFASAQLAAASFDVAQLVSDDLARSGRFKTMDRKDMIDQPHSGANVAFDDWRRLNNDYIVVGSMQSDATDHYSITYELYNVLTKQRLLGFQISSNRPGLRSAAHQIADAVFEKILGIRGAFSTRIAYISVLGQVPNRSYQLIVADADGENPRVVMQSREPLMSPSWSPDGKKMALVLSTRDGNLDVYILDLTTQLLSRITDDPGIDTEPQWSKDGQYLYFTSDRAGGPQIYKVGIKPGDKPRRLTFQGSYNAMPHLSPDESQLAFVTQEEGAFRIATMDLRGRGEVQVLTKGHFDISPSYAPNGAVLIYGTRDRGRGVLALVSADGRVQQRLVSSEGELQAPAWAPF